MLLEQRDASQGRRRVTRLGQERVSEARAFSDHTMSLTQYFSKLGTAIEPDARQRSTRKFSNEENSGSIFGEPVSELDDLGQRHGVECANGPILMQVTKSRRR
jgi:hypothetical protein